MFFTLRIKRVETNKNKRLFSKFDFKQLRIKIKIKIHPANFKILHIYMSPDNITVPIAGVHEEIAFTGLACVASDLGLQLSESLRSFMCMFYISLLM